MDQTNSFNVNDLLCIGMSDIQEVVDLIKDPKVSAVLFVDQPAHSILLAMTEVALGLSHSEFAKIFAEGGAPAAIAKVEEASEVLTLAGDDGKRLCIEDVNKLGTFSLEDYLEAWKEDSNRESGPDYILFYDPDVRGMLERVTGKPLDDFIIDRKIH